MNYYVSARRLEITCGEAPYLVSRYDTVSGEPIKDVRHRIGLLDRKLIVVSQHTEVSLDWIMWAKIALRATYGFEWQGDNLLLAREAIFVSFMEHYFAKFGKVPTKRELKGVAYIISWNVWQMDGLKYGLPGYEPKEKTDEQIKIEDDQPTQLSICWGTEDETAEPKILPQERLCRVKDMIGSKDIHRPNLKNQNFNDYKTRQQKFIDVINENSKKNQTKKSK